MEPIIRRNFCINAHSTGCDVQVRVQIGKPFTTKTVDVQTEAEFFKRRL